MDILNRLEKLGSITNKGDDNFLINQEFHDSIISEIKSLNCISNYCIDMPTNSGKGIIPVCVDGGSVISTFGSLIELDIKIANTIFELKDIKGFCPINETSMKFSKVALENLLAKELAKTIVRSLNKIAWDNICAVVPVSTVGTEPLYRNAVISLLDDVESACILCSEDHLSMLTLLSLDKEPNLFGVPIRVCEGFSGILFAKGSNLGYVHSDNPEIDYNLSAGFTKNISYVSVSHSADICVLNKTSMQCFNLL